MNRESPRRTASLQTRMPMRRKSLAPHAPPLSPPLAPPPTGLARRAFSASGSFSNKLHMRSIFNRKSRNRFQELGGARFQRASFRILRKDQMLPRRGSLPT